MTRLAAAVVALLGLAVAGCAETEGAPTAGPPDTPTSSRSSVPNTAPPSADVFAGYDKCQILDNALEGDGFEPAELNAEYSVDGCEAVKLGIEACTADTCQHDRMVDSWAALVFRPRALVELDFRDPGKSHRGDINGREAVLIKDPAEQEFGITGGCLILMQVGSSHHVTVAAGDDEDDAAKTEQDCKLAERFAKKVEPQLPK